MTTPENRNIQDLSAGRPEKRTFLFEGFNAPKKTIGPRLADGEDSQGLYSVDRSGRKWYHVDHIDGYSGRIIFYRNKGRDREMNHPFDVKHWLGLK